MKKRLKEKSVSYYIMDEWGNKTHAVSKNAVTRAKKTMNLEPGSVNSIKAHKLPVGTERYGRMPKEVIEGLKAGKKVNEILREGFKKIQKLAN